MTWQIGGDKRYVVAIRWAATYFMVKSGDYIEFSQGSPSERTVLEPGTRCNQHPWSWLIIYHNKQRWINLKKNKVFMKILKVTKPSHVLTKICRAAFAAFVWLTLRASTLRQLAKVVWDSLVIGSSSSFQNNLKFRWPFPVYVLIQIFRLPDDVSAVQLPRFFHQPAWVYF